MLKDITIGQYYPSDSPIHRLDPRTSVITLVIVIIFFVRYYSGYLFILALWPLPCILKIPFNISLRVQPLLFIILLTFSINIFFTPARPRCLPSGLSG